LRIVAAIMPRHNEAWIFKCMGPADELSPHAEAVIGFLKTVRFNDRENPPISWEMPENWQVDPAKEGRFATLRITPGIEVTISKLGEQELAANVNRWRGQVGLDPLPELEAMQTAREERTKAGDLIHLVDATGQGKRPRRPETDQPPPPKPATKTGKPIQFTVPGEWKEVEPAMGIEYAAFETKSSPPVRAAITMLRGDGGGLVANINRWRRQVGLGDMEPARLKAETKQTTVGGVPAVSVDLSGPSGKRLVGVIVPREGQTWFFKLSGPADAVGNAKSSFESFVGSARFGGGAE
jgi:hypothetical protein